MALHNSRWSEPVCLGEVLHVAHGWPFKSQHFSEQLSGQPIVVGIGNFEYTGGFRFGSTKTKEYRAEYPPEYELQANDILLAMTCQTSGGEILGIPGKIPDDGRLYLHNQRMGKVVIRDPSRIDRKFAYWVFLWSDFNRELYLSASGTKILHTAPKRIEAFRMRLPPLPEQRAIANILGALDDKIELNRRMNETLEAVARAVFKSWFVDFDPVRAKIDGRPPHGMDADTAALFPDRFEHVDGELVPAGWVFDRIDGQFDLTMGQSPPGSTYNEEGDGLPFFQGTRDFGFRFPSNRVYCSAPTRFGEAGDTLVSVRAPVGRLNVASERCCIGRGVAAIREKANRRSYTYYAVAELENDFAVYDGGGTVFGSIGKRDFSALIALSPPEPVRDAFERLAGPIDAAILNNWRESQTLAELRDTLLPKLLSGELSVPAAEGAVEEVA